MPSSGSVSVGDGVLQVWVGVPDGGVSGGQDTGTAGYIKLRKESLVCFFTWKTHRSMHELLSLKTEDLMKA